MRGLALLQGVIVSIFFEEILTMNHEHEPSVLISLCHFLLFLSGLLVGIAIYNLVEVPNNQIWPLTIGGILSIGLPVSFGFIRKKTLSEAFKELGFEINRGYCI